MLMGTNHELSDLQGETVPGSHNTDLGKRELVSLQQAVWAAQLCCHFFFFFPFSSLFFVFRLVLFFFFIYIAVFKTVVYFQASCASPLSPLWTFFCYLCSINEYTTWKTMSSKPGLLQLLSFRFLLLAAAFLILWPWVYINGGEYVTHLVPVLPNTWHFCF